MVLVTGYPFGSVKRGETVVIALPVTLVTGGAIGVVEYPACVSVTLLDNIGFFVGRSNIRLGIFSFFHGNKLFLAEIGFVALVHDAPYSALVRFTNIKGTIWAGGQPHGPVNGIAGICLLYTSPSPRDGLL